MSAHIFGSLGAGRLLGETYSLFFRRFLKFLSPVLLVLAAGGLLTLIFGRVFGGVFLFQVFTGDGDVFDILLFGLVALVIGSLYLTVMGTVALITIALKRGSQEKLIDQFGRALRSVPMLIVLGLAVVLVFVATGAVVAFVSDLFGGTDLAGFLLTLGMLVGSLYVYVKLAPILPIIVWERAGLASFRRSFELTRGYFWPIFGILVVNIFVIIVISVVVAALIGFAAILFAGFPDESLPYQLINILLGGISGVFSYLVPVVLSTLIYLRLRTLKEGADTDDIASVFE